MPEAGLRCHPEPEEHRKHHGEGTHRCSRRAGYRPQRIRSAPTAAGLVRASRACAPILRCGSIAPQGGLHPCAGAAPLWRVCSRCAACVWSLPVNKKAGTQGERGRSLRPDKAGTAGTAGCCAVVAPPQCCEYERTADGTPPSRPRPARHPTATSQKVGTVQALAPAGSSPPRLPPNPALLPPHSGPARGRGLARARNRPWQ